MKKRIDHLDVNFSARKVRGVLNFFQFKEAGYIIKYIPSLNLSAYGKTEKKCKDMLDEVLLEYFEQLTSLSSKKGLIELSQYGWKRSKWFNKQFENPKLLNEDQIRSELNIPQATQMQENSLAVAV